MKGLGSVVVVVFGVLSLFFLMRIHGVLFLSRAVITVVNAYG